MAHVLVMPGIERRDMVGDDLPDVQVLQAAIDTGVTSVIVIGRERDGSLYIGSASGDVDKVVGALFAAATYLATHQVCSVLPDDEEDEV